MAVEVVTQVYYEESQPQSIAGYTLLDIMINSALRILNDEYEVDTILNLQRVTSGTTKSLSQQFQLTINSASPEKSDCIEHCTGQINVESAITSPKPMASDNSFLRDIDTKSWYNAFVRHGLNYGPSLQRLVNLKGHYRQMLAIADVLLEPTKNDFVGESDYVLHPAALDVCLQLGQIAACSGQVEEPDQVYVPVSIGKTSIWLPHNAEKNKSIA